MTPSAKKFRLVPSRRKSFSVTTTPYGTPCPKDMNSAPILLAFRRSLKTWMCQLVYGLERAIVEMVGAVIEKSPPL